MTDSRARVSNGTSPRVTRNMLLVCITRAQRVSLSRAGRHRKDRPRYFSGRVSTARV